MTTGNLFDSYRPTSPAAVREANQRDRDPARQNRIELEEAELAVERSEVAKRYAKREAMKVELPKLKGALTRARKRGPLDTLREVVRAFGRFDEIGWPDSWHTWNIAGSDAISEVQYSRTELTDDERTEFSALVTRYDRRAW